MFTVISFYTKDWLYEQHAKRLVLDCDRLDLPCVIQERKTTGSYLKNTCMKPFFIREKLQQLKSPVLWVDCDGSILKKPDFFYGLKCDFAAKRMASTRSRTWHVGTMWFNYTPTMLEFMDRWCENTGEISDESALEKTWRQMKVNAADIPVEYFEILRGKCQPSQGAVIVHRISSGESKSREIKGAIEKAKSGIL